MNTALQSLIDRYQPVTQHEWENALREIVQELALLGLWRSKFFEHAAFYGGTALRIFHGLPRFSELAEDDFREHVYAPGRPCIIEGGARGWPALDRWTPVIREGDLAHGDITH